MITKDRHIEEHHRTIGDIDDLHDMTKYLYDDDEIKDFRMDEAIQNNPLAKKPTIMRSKLAYRELMKELKPTPKYLLPGQIAMFGYRNPKYKEELEYYDATPCVIFFGITRTNDNTIREIGFNLHYYPPFARMRILNTVYEVFKSYFQKYFNEAPNRPNQFVNYNILKRMLRRQKIAFGLRMYIPVLRGTTYVIPTRLVPTLAYTEGHFSGATLSNIRKFWRKSPR